MTCIEKIKHADSTAVAGAPKCTHAQSNSNPSKEEETTKKCDHHPVRHKTIKCSRSGMYGKQRLSVMGSKKPANKKDNRYGCSECEDKTITLKKWSEYLWPG